MDKKRFLLVISVPAIVILGFIGVNLYTVVSGQEILLKVAPIDPRDIFRGDYVLLTYEISTIDFSQVPYDTPFSSGDTIYAVLSKKEKFWTIDSVHHTKPALTSDQVCMKGRVTQAFSTGVIVEWGIESYFVPEGKGRIVEDLRRKEDISVIVVVDSSGSSVLKELLINDEPVE